ncbi:hypothetical protein CPB86DRAFT_803002 [Serendipita vermifera]|nr:hypothetical protein CPB86DRAFT_803002 [Serendipita vermifera]
MNQVLRKLWIFNGVVEKRRGGLTKPTPGESILANHKTASIRRKSRTPSGGVQDRRRGLGQSPNLATPVPPIHPTAFEMSRTPNNDRFQALDSALAVTKAVQGTLTVDPVSSPIKAATTALITVLETIREVKSNKEAWIQLGIALSSQIDAIGKSLNECTPPHSTALVIMANRYEV